MITDTVMTLLANVGKALPDVFSELGDFVIEAIKFINESLTENTAILLSGLGVVIENVAKALPQMLTILSDDIIPRFAQLINDVVVDQLPVLLVAAGELMQGLVKAAPSILNILFVTLPEVLNSLMNAISDNQSILIDGITNLVEVFAVDVVPELAAVIAETAPEFIDVFLDAVMLTLPDIIMATTKLATALSVQLPQICMVLVSKIPEIMQKTYNKMMDNMWRFEDAGQNIVNGLWQGIQDNAGQLWQNIQNWLGGIWDEIVNFFDIHSPSRKMAWIGDNLVLGITKGINEEAKTAVNATRKLAAEIADVDFGIDYSMRGAVSRGSVAAPVISITFGDVSINSDMDINDVADKISRRIAANVVAQGGAF